jgi:hypothetical protein
MKRSIHTLDSSLPLGMTSLVMLNDAKHPRNRFLAALGMTSLVMLNDAKHPCTGFLAALGMTSLVMLNDAKHPHTGFLAALGMTSLVMLNDAKHPHTGFLAALGMTSLVMLSEAKHPHTGFLATARNDRKNAWNDTKNALGITAQYNLCVLHHPRKFALQRNEKAAGQRLFLEIRCEHHFYLSSIIFLVCTKLPACKR